MSVVAIVGRPNVGKSTLFNRLAGKKLAIVEDIPGVTRDRNYTQTKIEGRNITLVDTGGLAPLTEDPLMGSMAVQVGTAVDEADVILFVTDAADGLTGLDQEIANYLRKRRKDPIVVVNKVDGPSREPNVAEFYAFGFTHVIGVSAAHKSGMSDLEELILSQLPEGAEAVPFDPDVIRVAVMGRPNTGKSSFVNAIFGSERVVVSPIAGTTRDTVDTHVSVEGRNYLLIDTAGIRKKSKVEVGVELWSVLRAIKTIERAHVCLLLVDAVEGLTDQDIKIMELILDGGKGVIICLNKWDAVEKDEKTFDQERKDIALRLGTNRHVPVISMSALTGQRVARAFGEVDKVFEDWKRHIPTSKLNTFLEGAMRELPPPIVGKKRARIYYGTQVQNAPPLFNFYSSYPEGIPEHYERYLINKLRDTFGFAGVPFKMRILKRRRGEEE